MSLISPAEAEAFILPTLTPLPTEIMSLYRALGRVLREPIVADRAFPPFDRVTMDGIAFRKDELTHGSLKLHGLHAAGDPTPDILPPGACWQIMTGASLPPDCDTVVPYEEVEIDEIHAHVTGEGVAGQFIHRLGSDASTGDLLVPVGTRIGPGQIGLAASVGATQLEVTRLPRITVLGTGDELVSPEEEPASHQLRQSNGLTLKAAVENWGAAEVTLGHLADDLEATKSGIKEAMESSDLVILSGGISKGKKDYVRPALEALIGPPLFHGVAQKPGKPLAFWGGDSESEAKSLCYGVAALPGNPNSTLTTFHRYLVPALRALVGLPQEQPILLPLESLMKQHERLTLYLPALLNEEGKLRVLRPQNSGDFVTPLSAQGFVEIPPGNGVVENGEFRYS